MVQEIYKVQGKVLYWLPMSFLGCRKFYMVKKSFK